MSDQNSENLYNFESLDNAQSDRESLTLVFHRLFSTMLWVIGWLAILNHQYFTGTIFLSIGFLEIIGNLIFTLLEEKR